MTKQEIIDRVYDHFVTNKSPFGFNEGSMRCEYRVPGSYGRCAIGLFMDDETADEWHNHNVTTVSPDTLRQIFGENYSLKFLSALQQTHDRCASSLDVPDDQRHKVFGFMLESLALGFGLYQPGA